MSTVNDLTNEAGFIFEAEVEQLGTSNAAGFPASPETAVVRIAKTLQSPTALAGYTGQRITVVLQPPVSLKVGQSAVFFTHGIHYGEGLVVREVGNMPPELTLGSQVTDAVQAGRDSQLTQRLAQADLAITGIASVPRPYLAVPGGRLRVSEHDPDWWVSTINVETVEKGVHAGPTKDILFPNSTDIVWHRSPKVKAGDHGVWLLHKRDHFGKPVPDHAVVHPLDFQPIDQTERIRTLLKSGK